LKNRLGKSISKDSYRPYTINFNLEKDAKPRDILHSYYLGRLIDHNLRTKGPTDRDINFEDLKLAKRRSEWQLEMTDFQKAVILPMREKGWSEEFIYLDGNRNRFEIDRNGAPRHHLEEEQVLDEEIKQGVN